MFIILSMKKQYKTLLIMIILSFSSIYCLRVPVYLNWSNTTERNNDLVRCIIESDASPCQLAEKGIQVITDLGNIKSAVVPLQSLNNPDCRRLLRKIYKDVSDIELMDNSRPYNYISSRYAGINADSVHAEGFTGAGVIIGIIDSHPFNWAHAAFKDDEDSTRILRIWDQQHDGNAPSGYDFGYEYSESDLNSGSGPAIVNGYNHGTQCAGIASGDGSGSINNELKGIAPGASIIYVQKASGTSYTIDAINYIKQISDAAYPGVPVVLSISLGTFWGEPDGSHPVAEALESFSGEGRAVSVAGGNWYNSHQLSASATSYSNPVDDIEIEISGSLTENIDYLVSRYYYYTGDQFNLRITDPGSTQYAVISGTSSFDTPYGRVYVAHDSTAIDNPYIEFVVSDESGTITAGDIWTLSLEPISEAHDDNGGEWWGQVYSSGIDAEFNNYTVQAPSLNVYGMSESVILVGGYSCSNGRAYWGSSFGGYYGIQKPDVSAPTDVYAPDASSDTGYSSLCCTSGAAPHVAGTAALLLEKYNDADASYILNKLTDNVYTDIETQSSSYGGNSPNYKFGYGKLNAKAAVDASALQVNAEINGTGEYDFVSQDTIAVIDFVSESIDTLKLIKHTSKPSNIPDGSTCLSCWFDIDAGGAAFNADLTLYYTDEELAGAGFTSPSESEARLSLYRFNGAEWQFAGGVVNTANNSVTVTGVTEFSNWAIGDPEDQSLPVILSSFEAVAISGNKVSLDWSLGSDSDLLGFTLYRNDNEFYDQAEFLTFEDISTTVNTLEFKYIDNDTEDIPEGTKLYYWLQIVSLDGNSVTHGPVSATLWDSDDIPPYYSDRTELKCNYPNPFNPETTIEYRLKGRYGEPINVNLTIYNAKGQKVISLVDGIQSLKEKYTVKWNGRDESGKPVSSGVYFYKLRTNDSIQTRKMVLMK